MIIAFGIEEIKIIFSPKLHKPFISYTPFWFEDEADNQKRADFSQVKEDLDLVKFLGFEGIKLFCIEGLDYHNLTIQLFDYCHSIGLKITLPFRIWRQEQFPNNQTAVEEFMDFLSDLIPKVKDKEALYFYVVHYPVDYSDIYGYAKRNFKNGTYITRLQEIISLIQNLDTKHDIYMALEFDPKLEAPYDLDFVKGFGVEPYLWNTPYCIDLLTILYHLGYLEIKGKVVFIDEYGLQTNRGFRLWRAKHGEVKHGYCVNEQTKAKILRDFVIWVLDKPYPWSYFALHDTAEADWGLAYSNNTLKYSGQVAKHVLSKIKK